MKFHLSEIECEAKVRYEILNLPPTEHNLVVDMTGVCRHERFRIDAINSLPTMK